MPTDDPRFAGLTNSGMPKFFLAVAKEIWPAARQKRRNFATGTPRPAANASSRPCPCPLRSLKLRRPRKEDSASFNKPWTVPSSPKGPCKTGNTTSMPSAPPRRHGESLARAMCPARLRRQCSRAEDWTLRRCRVKQELAPLRQRPTAFLIDADATKSIFVLVHRRRRCSGRKSAKSRVPRICRRRAGRHGVFSSSAIFEKVRSGRTSRIEESKMRG